MKSIKMGAFIVLAFPVFLTGLQISVRAELTRQKKERNILEYFKQQMSILNAFDLRYNTVQENMNVAEEYGKAADEYAKKMADVYAPFLKNEEFPNKLLEYKYHYLFFASSAERLTGKQEAFIKAYLTYYSFWASLTFRVGVLYYEQAATTSPNFEGDLAKKCDQIHAFLHWFTFIEFEEKISEFRAIAKLLPWNSEFAKTIHNTADIMSKLDLDFVMDAEYLEKVHPKGFETPDNIVEWGQVPTYRKMCIIRKSDCTLFPSSNVKRIMKHEDVHCIEESAERQKNEELYYKLWDQVIRSLKETILQVELFFHITLSGFPIPEAKYEMQTFIPTYDRSLEIWSSVNEFIRIRNLPTQEPREMSGGTGSKLYRSNAVEIIRRIIEIKVNYALKMLLIEEGTESSNQNTCTSDLKDQPPFNFVIRE